MATFSVNLQFSFLHALASCLEPTSLETSKYDKHQEKESSSTKPAKLYV